MGERRYLEVGLIDEAPQGFKRVDFGPDFSTLLVGQDKVFSDRDLLMVRVRKVWGTQTPRMLDELMHCCGGSEATISYAPVTISADLAHGMIAILSSLCVQPA